MNTKERILIAALELFASKGYEATSARDIASEIGIKAPSLYAHYKSKQDIMDSIVRKMEADDAEAADEFELPETNVSDSVVTMENIIMFSLNQFKYWTEDPFASKFRKMLTVEQYRNEKMQTLYQQYLGAGPLGYVEEFFKGLDIDNPKKKAIEFYGPMYLAYTLFDSGMDGKELAKQLKTHFETFR